MVFDINAPKIARFVWKKRLLAAWIRRLDHRIVRGGIRSVGLVDEEESWLAVPPGRLRNLIQDLTGIELPDDLAGPGTHEVVCPTVQRGLHERIRNRDADVEIGHFFGVGLARDELQNVG